MPEAKQWTDRYRKLTREQRNDFNVVMTMTDYSLHRLNHGDCLDGRGRLKPELARSRNEIMDRLLTELESGASLRATFPDRLPQLARTRNGTPGTAITELPEFDFTEEGMGDDNPVCDECLIDLWREANEQAMPPIPPYNSNPADGRTFAHVQKLRLDSSDLHSAPLYISDEEYYSKSGERKLFVKTLNEPDLAYLSSYGSKNFEIYMTNKIVLKTNEWLHEHDSQLTISQAQALRDAIRVDFAYRDTPYQNLEEAYEQMFDHNGSDGLPVAGRVESFLKDRDLMPEITDSESETLAQSVQNDPRMDLFPEDATPNVGLMGEYELIRRNGLVPVDIFGTEYSTRIQGERSSHAMRQSVALYNDVHMYLTGDKDAQLAKAGIISTDYDAVRAAQTFNVSVDDMLVARDMATMYHYNNGRLIGLDGKYEDLQPNANYNIQHDRSLSIGQYASELDRAGISQLRKYLKKEDAHLLDIDIGQLSDTQRQMLLRSVENADAIINYMRENGIEFELQKDEVDNEIRARLSNGLDVRLLDVNHPEMVGRVYGDSLITVVQPRTAAISSVNVKAFPGRLYESPYDSTKAVYMPSREEAVAALRARLGDAQPNPMNPSYQVGARMKLVGPNNEMYKTSKGAFINASYKSKSNSMQAVGVLHGVQAASNYGKSSRMISVDIPVNLSTTRAPGMSRVTVPGPEESMNRLQAMIREARSNVQDQIFGTGLTDQIANALPEYKKTQWVSYRRDSSQPDGYARDENGDRIVWRTSKRNQELLDNAGKAPDLESVAISDDPNIRVMQEAYLAYLSSDDAILRGIVDGKAVDETREEYNARVQAEIAERAMNLELETEEPAVQNLMASMNGLFGLDDDRYTQQEKYEHIQEHFSNYAGHMFGRVAEDGALEINTASLKKYAGVEDADICRLIQEAQKEYDIRLIGPDEKEIQHVKERIVDFDSETAMDITDSFDARLSPYMKRVSQSAREAMQSSGCTVKEILIDSQGVLKYTGIRETSDTGATPPEEISGTVGQLFEPDSRGVILTKYGHGDNVAMITRMRGYVVPGPGSLEANTRVYDNIDTQMSELKHIVSKQLNGMVNDKLEDGRLTDPLDATAMNRLYRAEDAPRLGLDYMAELEAKGMTREQAEAYVASCHNAVRYDSEFAQEGGLLAEMKRNRENFIDDVNVDRLSLAGRRIGDLGQSEAGYFCPYATSGARDQGLTRYLTEGARVEDHKIIPSEVPGDKCALLNQDFCKYMDYNSFDRNQMSASNLLHSYGVEQHVKMAHVTLGGWNMDDANVISLDFAERHLIPTENVEDTKALDARIIERNLPKETYLDSDGNEQVRVAGPFLDEDGKFKQQFRGRLYEVDPSSEISIAEQVKAGMIEQGVGLRRMKEGDKLCDMNGNKGVISKVVDPNMNLETAERLGITELVRVFHDNPELEVAGAPFTAVSRFNGGTVRSMMEDPQPLKMPDGRVIQGGIGTLPMVISDNTVDHKSHVYDDEAMTEGKGRKASSQLGWALQALGCKELMEFCYGENEANMRAIREKMIVLGVDFDEDYNLRLGYQAHALPDGSREDRPHIKIDTDLIDMSGNIQKTNNGAMYYKSRAASREAADDAVRQAMAHGGMLELPFPVKLASGETTQLDEASGKYLLPILPIEYRADKGYESDGSISSTNFNAYYRDIIREAAAWEAESKAQALAGGDVKVDIEKSKQNQVDAANKAQKRYNEMAQGVIAREFEGKYNVWKSKAMSHRLENSATLVITPDPRLGVNEVAVDPEVAKTMGVFDGDPILFWRDPILRDAGTCTMIAKYRQPEEAGRQDLGINPATDKPFDGDFDGDSVGKVGLRKAKYEITAVMKEYDAAETDAEKAEIKKASGMSNHKWSEQRKIYESDEARLAAVHDKMAFEKRLYDKSLTPVKPKTADDIKLGLNMGLDVASGANALAAKGDTTYVDAEKACREAILNKNYDEALAQANKAVHAACAAAYGSDAMDYSSDESITGSWDHIITESRAKGKLAAMETVALTLNADIPFIRDEQGNAVHIDAKNAVIHRGDRATPWTKECPESLDEKAAAAWKEYQNGMKGNYSGSAICTALKSEFTGLYGSYAQKMVAALRDVSDNDGTAVIAYGLQMTYGGTQANLQSKHDVVAAIERSEATEALAALWRGQKIVPGADGKWTTVMTDNGYPAKMNKNDWIDTANRFFHDKHGLNVDAHPDVIRYVGEALYTGPVDKYGVPTVRQGTGKRSSACTLDRLAYGGGFNELIKSARENKNLFDSKLAAQFKPNNPVAKPEMKVRTVSFEAKENAQAMSFSAEAAAAKKAAKLEQARAARDAVNPADSRAAADAAVKAAMEQADRCQAKSQRQMSGVGAAGPNMG